MSRNLALFFDGTWDNARNRTNVVELYDLTVATRQFRGAFHEMVQEEAGTEPTAEAVQRVEQIKYYHQGVGVSWGEKIRGGAFGYGLSENIKEGYLWLAQHYQPGDAIYVFGFSRGAYTARSLVGLIRKCSILKQASKDGVKKAYDIYRNKAALPDGPEASAFRASAGWPDVKVKFIGVWDTVGALGVPLHHVWFSSDYYRWHDTDLSGIVENAYHALALDEHRPPFAATLWSKDKIPAPGQNVEQRWFAGAHGDVGGGYSDGKLQQIPLRWIQQKAQECGLQFVRDIEVNDDAYLGPMHDSFKEFMWGIYDLLPGTHRYYRPLETGVNEKINDWVFKRIQTPGATNERGEKYSPPQLANQNPAG